jgi:hypothetical protein
MKQLLQFNPVFTPGAAGVGTLDFSMYPNFNLDKLYAVIDLTTNIPLYIPGAPGLGVASVSSPASGFNSAANGTILTLQVNTSACNSSDRLSIFYDTQPGYGGIADPVNNSSAELGGQLQQLQEHTNAILKELMVMNYILAEGLNVRREDVTQMRADIFNIQNTEFPGTGSW